MRSSAAVGTWRHRAIALAIGIATTLLIILAGSRSSSLATTGGSAYAVPEVTDSNPAPDIVETTLTAEPASVDLGQGVTATNALTFNGTIPGPTFMLNVGDHVIVHYENRLAHESAVHWHGIELPNGMDGTPFTQNMVPPGGDYLYEFTVNRPGTFWYHPHHHSSTNQVFHGLYGMIIVKDPNEDALQSVGTLPSDAQTFPLVLSDTTVCKAVNDTHAYDDNMVAPAGAQPWAGGGGAADTLPPQPDPSPKNLCEGPAVGNDMYPLDEDGAQTTPFSAGQIPNIQPADNAGRVNEGQTVLTNGRNVGARGGGPLADQPGGLGALAAGAELLDVQPGQGIRFEVLNSSTTRFMRLHLTDPTGAKVNLFRVGGEGGLLNSAVGEGGTQQGWVTKFDPGEILVPPGTRADIVAAIPTAPTTGVMTLWTRDYDRTGGGFARIPTVPVAHLNLTGATVTPAFAIAAGTPLRQATGDLVPTLGAATGNLLNPATFTPAKLGMAAQNVKFTNAANASLGVDGVIGAHEVPANVDYTDAAHMGSTRYAKSGDILQLTVENVTGADHPFHLHGFSIQPILLDGPAAADDYAWTFPEFRDNVDVPKNYKLTFRIRLDPRPMADGVTPGGELGRWLFHCHIFFHTEDGMISELVVTDANGNEAPTVDVTGTSTTVAQGAPATMQGTYDDRDGDAVTLAASSGAVTDDGGGRWTWTETIGAEGASKTVFITATDSKGNHGQAPFDLNVTPTAPTLTDLKVNPKKFFAKGPDVALAKKGANIAFAVSKSSTVSFLVHKVKPKPKVGDKTFTRTLTAGGQTIPFTGKFNGKKLKKGKYSLTATATDNGGLQSAPATTKFKIKQKAKKKHGHK